MNKRKGPADCVIPEQRFKVCTGCIYHRSEPLIFGRDPKNAHYCKHPDKKETQLSRNTVFGEYIGDNPNTPEWCPVAYTEPLPEIMVNNCHGTLRDFSKDPEKITLEAAIDLMGKDLGPIPSMEVLEVFKDQVSQQIKNASIAENSRLDCGMMWTAEPLEDQVERLALFILSTFRGYPKNNEGAIDTAISIMRDLQEEKLKNLPGQYKKVLKEREEKVTTFQEIDDYAAKLIINRNASTEGRLAQFDTFVKMRIIGRSISDDISDEVVRLLQHAEKVRLTIETYK